MDKEPVETTDCYTQVEGGRTHAGRMNGEISGNDEQGARSFWNRRPFSVINVQLLWYKIFFFFFLGGLGSVISYYSVYFKQLGLSPQQIGLIAGLRPFVGFLSGPIWGAISDRFRIRKILFLISISAWIAIFVALAFIPAAERIDKCPENIETYRPPNRILRDVSKHTENSTIGAPSSANLSHHEIQILQENLSWIYTSSGLNRVMITIVLLIVFGEIFQSPATALADAGTLHVLGTDKLDKYAHQRSWGALGWGCSALVTGALISRTRNPETLCGVLLYFSDYWHYVFIFIPAMIISFISATQFKFKENKSEASETIELKEVNQTAEAPHSTKAVLKLFLSVHYGSWLLTIFFVGVLNGVIWGFLFWHLENLGANQLLMGVVSVVTCSAEFISYYVIPQVIKRIDHMPLMYIGIFCYAVRFVIYACIKEPWLVMPAEVLQGVTFSAIWVSMTMYSTKAVPTQSLATIQGILHGVYFGLGVGGGLLIGGLLIGAYGAVITFLACSAASLVVLVFFIIAQKCSEKPEISIAGYSTMSE